MNLVQEGVDDAAAEIEIQAGGGLIDEEEGGVTHQRAGDGDALSFAAGEARGDLIANGGEVELVEKLVATGEGSPGRRCAMTFP